MPTVATIPATAPPVGRHVRHLLHAHQVRLAGRRAGVRRRRRRPDRRARGRRRAHDAAVEEDDLRQRLVRVRRRPVRHELRPQTVSPRRLRYYIAWTTNIDIDIVHCRRSSMDKPAGCPSEKRFGVDCDPAVLRHEILRHRTPFELRECHT